MQVYVDTVTLSGAVEHTFVKLLLSRLMREVIRRIFVMQTKISITCKICVSDTTVHASAVVALQQLLTGGPSAGEIYRLMAVSDFQIGTHIRPRRGSI